MSPPANNQNSNPSLVACHPEKNATVSASAGSGKTWLLITRIVRLLLHGAEPGNIIALTFTRKAANEMQIRLGQRLYDMAIATESELSEHLDMIGCDNTDSTKLRARGLYEKLVHSLYPVRIQTFHSFCQDILSRFPLEADVPPGFELIEDSRLLELQAWQTLFDDALKPPGKKTGTGGDLAQHLDIIMLACNGPSNTKTALNSFLAHRSDWWAFTVNQKKPAEFACQQLLNSLDIRDTGINDPVDLSSTIKQFINDITKQKLKNFSGLLLQHPTATNTKHAASIDLALGSETSLEQLFKLVRSAFLTQKDTPLARKPSATLDKKLGKENAQRYLDLHSEISDILLQLIEQLNRLQTFNINRAWYFAGQHYLEIFQRLKNEQRQLDFTDLEWKCYQLLQQVENAHWVQYKIDQRIDHMLIDEFQDTNPTQWQLLLPILEEIAADPDQRPRSVFLVGDEKQSIYSFRRANPELQAQASAWLQQHLDAAATPLDFSRRSSAAIMHCVNAVFTLPQIETFMPEFALHDTHLKEIPGQVVLCDLFEKEAKDETEAVYFRNPLQQQLIQDIRTAQHDEAEFIADEIKTLIETNAQLTEDGKVRCIQYGDIMILLRTRLHVEIYENALKKANIPYIGSKKGGLLDNLEIQDLICLLNTLITPFNNLALAQVLRSPVFNVDDSDLMFIARHTGRKHWYETLLSLATENINQLSPLLKRAATLLPRWQQYADHLPVHDCLDKIFTEGNIINRYIAANHHENKQKVSTNCQQLLSMSLDTDSGRYPGISRFLRQLTHLQTNAENPPEEPLIVQNDSRVSILTIHASKGLEAPVIFLADTGHINTDKTAFSSIVNWPAESGRPANFQLQLAKKNTDEKTRALQDRRKHELAREDINLLYVAMTRAREQLYITATRSSKNQQCWYDLIATGMKSLLTEKQERQQHGCSVYTYRTYTDIEYNDTSKTEATEPDLAPTQDLILFHPVKTFPERNQFISPSTVSEQSEIKTLSLLNSAAGTARGQIIHRALELLCTAQHYPPHQSDIERIQHRLNKQVTKEYPELTGQLENCFQEALNTYTHDAFKSLFDLKPSQQAFNELPILYREQNNTVYGFIDRVILSDTKACIIDYKSHQAPTDMLVDMASHQFKQQMDYYREAARRLWPALQIKTGILYTHYNEIVWTE